jgi:hypothetical protein
LPDCTFAERDAQPEPGGQRTALEDGNRLLVTGQRLADLQALRFVGQTSNGNWFLMSFVQLRIAWLIGWLEGWLSGKSAGRLLLYQLIDFMLSRSFFSINPTWHGLDN